MTDLSLDKELDITLDTEEPKAAHIVDRGEDTRSAPTIILEAMINGTSITALCGHTWVPSRDPNKYPVCSKCLEIFEFVKDYRGV